MKRRQNACWLLASAALAAALFGCDGEEPIRAYHAPKDPAPVATPATTEAAPQASRAFTWDVPDGWSQQAASPPVFAAFVLPKDENASADAEPARVTVTRLPGTGGGALANINRWRDQLGLAPIESLDQQPMQRFDVGEHPAAIMTLVAEPADDPQSDTTIAVILPVEATGETWFFKLTGTREQAERHRSALVEFTQSLRLGEQATAADEAEQES